MQWGALSNGIPTSVVTANSLRSGGNKALFSAGIDWVTIQRWGRWRIFIFHEYMASFGRFSRSGRKHPRREGARQIFGGSPPATKETRLDVTPVFHTGRHSFSFRSFVSVPRYLGRTPSLGDTHRPFTLLVSDSYRIHIRPLLGGFLFGWAHSGQHSPIYRLGYMLGYTQFGCHRSNFSASPAWALTVAVSPLGFSRRLRLFPT